MPISRLPTPTQRSASRVLLTATRPSFTTRASPARLQSKVDAPDLRSLPAQPVDADDMRLGVEQPQRVFGGGPRRIALKAGRSNGPFGTHRIVAANKHVLSGCPIPDCGRLRQPDIPAQIHRRIALPHPMPPTDSRSERGHPQRRQLGPVSDRAWKGPGFCQPGIKGAPARIRQFWTSGHQTRTYGRTSYSKIEPDDLIARSLGISRVSLFYFENYDE